jgi:hypothetical protein
MNLKYINLYRFSMLYKYSYFKDIIDFKDKIFYILFFPVGYFLYLKNKKELNELINNA